MCELTHLLLCWAGRPLHGHSQFHNAIFHKQVVLLEMVQDTGTTGLIKKP